MSPQKEFADPSEEESSVSNSSSSDPNAETNAEITILEPPDWDGNASDFADRGKTTLKRLLSWGPLFTICITLIVSLFSYMNPS